MIRLFVGFDAREAQGHHTFEQSLIETSGRVALTVLAGEQGDGSNAFTYERYRIPELMGWSGFAIFLDGADMLLRAPLGELWAMCDGNFAVQVVKHDYRTRHPRKYVGTVLECENRDYPRKNWSSAMIWNCTHLAHFRARERMRSAKPSLHGFDWLADAEIGELPFEWNWLADEYGENPQAKLLHWTAGIPGFAHYRQAPHAAEWHAAAARARGEHDDDRRVERAREPAAHVARA